MSVETATTIAELDKNWPLPGDPTNEGDNHTRLTKSVLQSQFPGAGGLGFNTPITASEADLNNTSGSTSNFQAQIDALAAQLSTVVQAAFPVGTIHTTIDPTNPSTSLGFGTWARYAEGRCLVGLDSSDPDFDTVEEVGGRKDAVVAQHSHTGATSAEGNHTHFSFSTAELDKTSPVTAAEQPARYNNRPNTSFYDYQINGDSTPATVGLTSQDGLHTHTVSVSEAGQDPTGENLPPYVVVYFWVRTA